MDDRLGLVADLFVGADTAVAFTGAGVSTASGVPDFRNGNWDGFDLGEYHVSNLQVDPRGFWRTHVDFHDRMYDGGHEPNVAHEVLAYLEREGWLDAVVTQNTDGLHQRAGSEHVVELHGNGTRAVCQRCRREIDADDAVARAREGHYPPLCERCGGILRPDVTLFGERLPGEAEREARRLAEECDVMLVLGSSLAVEPGASIATSVARGGTLVLVNDEGTEADRRAAATFRADVTEFLPELAETILDRA
ncbi:MAG: Sir2 family NAD-dependent protein deacetylase [Haloferacaceae archaeon]